MSKYIIYDTETGGLDPENTSLLTAYFAVLDDNLEIIDNLDLVIKHEEYGITAEALKVNKIDLVKHHELGVTLSNASRQLETFLKKHADFKNKLTPIGHNVNFDDSFIYTQLLDKKSWEKYVSYRKLDTAVIANFLKLTKVLEENQSISLGSLAELFSIDNTAAHNAKVDVLMTLQILKHMIDINK